MAFKCMISHVELFLLALHIICKSVSKQSLKALTVSISCDISAKGLFATNLVILIR